jgi:hypothetical protein
VLIFHRLVECIRTCLESGNIVFTVALNVGRLTKPDLASHPEQHPWVSALETPTDAELEFTMLRGRVFKARCPNCRQTARKLVGDEGRINDVGLAMVVGTGAALLARLRPPSSIERPGIPTKKTGGEKKKRTPSAWNNFVKKNLPTWNKLNPGRNGGMAAVRRRLLSPPLHPSTLSTPSDVLTAGR